MFGSRHDAFPRVVFTRPDGLDGIGVDRRMAAIGPTISHTPGSPADAIAAQKEARDPVIFHLTGEMAVLSGGDGKAAQALFDSLDDLRVAGGHVIWSRVDLPRDDLHQHLANELWSVASRVHLPSFAAVEDLRALDGRFDLPLVSIIPDGNFLGLYPSKTKAASRAALGLAEDAHVFLLADGLEAGMAAFADLADENVAILVPDPKAGDARATPVDLNNPDGLATAHAAADTVLLPYGAAIGSVPARLAAGFGRGILGSDVAALRDLVRHEWSGRLYGTAEEDGLVRALRVALNEGREVWEARGRVAASIAEARDNVLLSNQWRDLYFSLALRPRARVIDGTRIAIA